MIHVHETPCRHVIVRSEDMSKMESLVSEIQGVMAEIEEICSANGSGEDMLLAVIDTKVSMMSPTGLCSTDQKLFSDTKEQIQGMLCTFDGKSISQVKYLRLLVDILQSLFKGEGEEDMSDQVRAVVEGLVENRKLFTAWNVTKTLRENGKKAFHKESQKEVRKMWDAEEMGDYREAVVQPDGFPKPATLYYPPEADPNEFTGDIMTAKVQPTPPQQEDDDYNETTGDNDGGDQDDEDGVTVGTVPGTKKVIRKLTADGILYVPRWMGRDMNAKPGKVCVAAKDAEDPLPTTEVCVYVGFPDSSSGLLSVHVDPRTNIRIGQKALKKLGADWKAYEIEKVGNEVVIREAK